MNEFMSKQKAVVTAGDVIDYIETLYPPDRAENWDRVGLIVGGRSRPAKRVLLALDPVPEVIAQAVAGEFDLLVTHHPLYLRGTSFVSEDDAKGRMVADLIRADCALYNAHTNADVSVGGVADALAELVGVENCEPLVGTDTEHVGSGRIGTVPTQTLRQFALHVANVLPAGPQGLLVGGDLDAPIRRVAVSGGSGDSFLDAARKAEADVFITADLRHHPASEHLMEGKPALICGSHWATESPWLPILAKQLRENPLFSSDNLDVVVSDLVTEPWNLHLQTKGKTQ